ncbi:MAG: hypothetical protein D6729_11570 [Deltaproteobacteria bacterium]|nr:MAG: hypothetical protein D6729_11570 [Deltaproteobacteria bacterium]
MAAWAFRGDLVALSAGPGAAGRVALSVATKRDVEELPPFQRARARFGNGVQLVAFATQKGAGQVDPEWAERFPASALGLSVGASGVTLDAYLGLDATATTALQPFRLEPDAGEAMGWIAPDALLAGRLTADLARAWALWKEAGRPGPLEALDAQLVARGLDGGALLRLLGTDYVFYLELAKSPNLARMPSLDPRRTNPFEYVRLTVLCRLRDAEALRAHLPAVAEALAPVLRARIEAGEIEGTPVWTVHYRLGEGMTFGVVGDTLVVTGGAGAFADARRRVLHPETAFAASLDDRTRRRLAEEGSLAVVLHVPNARRILAGLDASAFGGGPGGIMIKSAVDRLVAPLEKVRVVTGVAEAETGGVGLRVDLAFTAAAPSTP